GRCHVSLHICTIGLKEFLSAIQIFPVVLETSHHIRPCGWTSKDGPCVPRPSVILALVPCHVLLTASLVLLGHARLDAIDMDFDNFAAAVRALESNLQMRIGLAKWRV